MERLIGRGGGAERLRQVKLAAIGPGTAAELTRFGLHAEIVPTEYRAESLAAALAPMAAGRRFLLARANRGRQVLPEQLVAAGGIVEQVVVYSTLDVRRPEPEVAAALELATARTFSCVSGFAWEPRAMAHRWSAAGSRVCR